MLVEQQQRWMLGLRNEKGLTMKQVASNANISEGYYCLIESGKRCPPVKVAQRIALVLGFDWRRFYEAEEA